MRVREASANALRAGVVVTVVAGLLTGASGVAQASSGNRGNRGNDVGAPQVFNLCAPNSVENMDFSSWGTTRTITHDKYVSVPAGGSIDLISNVTRIATISSTITITAGGSFSGDVVIARLSLESGVSLALYGSLTTQGSETVQWHLGPGQYAVFHGEKKFKGNWSALKCNAQGSAYSNSAGTGQSFALSGEGAASCSVNYASGTFEAAAKAFAC